MYVCMYVCLYLRIYVFRFDSRVVGCCILPASNFSTELYTHDTWFCTCFGTGSNILRPVELENFRIRSLFWQIVLDFVSGMLHALVGNT